MNEELSEWVRHLPLAKRARELAAKAHREQKYGDAPYLTHLDTVAEIVAVHRLAIGDTWEHALASAFLHDLIEDQPEHTAELESTMPELVSAIVHALSKRDDLAMPDYFEGIRRAGRLAVAVKLADRIANVEAGQASGASALRKLTRYRAERELFATMRTAGDLEVMWERLERAY